MLSIWEKQSFLSYDFIIIGAGIVGLSTAISIKEKNKNASVLVLERGLFPTGASTRNAGFACFGSFTELLTDTKVMGEEAAMKIVHDRWFGLAKLRNRLGDKNIRYENLGGYELLSENETDCLEYLEKINHLLRPLFTKDVFVEDKDLVQKFGFNSSRVQTVLYNSFEAQLDSGKMMKSLLHLSYSLAIEILTGAEVSSYYLNGDKVIVQVMNKHLNSFINFSATGAAICTNAFTQKLLPFIDINPGRGVILVTKPIYDLKIKGAFHFQEGYYYFRNLDNRILFGGGRNLDFEGETTVDFFVNEKILSALNYYLQDMIMPGIPYEVDHVWSGIMAFGKTKEPMIEKINDKVVVGAKLSGMGVAIGTLVGEKVANLLLE